MQFKLMTFLFAVARGVQRNHLSARPSRAASCFYSLSREACSGTTGDAVTEFVVTYSFYSLSREACSGTTPKMDCAAVTVKFLFAVARGVQRNTTSSSES